MPRVCAFEGCDRHPRSKGLCVGHTAQKKRGKELFPLNSTKRKDGSEPVVRISEQECPVKILEGPCHIFEGGKISTGYGMVWSGRKFILAHRYVWEKTHGEIPKGLVIDHVCRVRSCCNVGHLRVVTSQINAIENNNSVAAVNKRKTHCPKGHEYTEENTGRWEKGSRRCKQCNRDKSLTHYHQHKKAGV